MKYNIYNVSDEMLAAYLEGRTNAKETMQVLEALRHNPELREIVGIALDIDDEQPVELPMMRLAAESGEKLCGVLCEAYVLRRRKIDFDEQGILELARKNNWLRENGTPLHALGNILANENLMVTRRYDVTLETIAEALAQDNDVIVAVNCKKLDPNCKFGNDANHAVVVTAVDNKANTVTVFDPKSNSIKTLPAATFEGAWKESQHYMVRILQSVWDYQPQPIDMSKVMLSDDFIELREAIAENAHEVWAEARMHEVWTYGPVRDDEKKQHPDLVPYSSLSDSEKEYDRIMATNTIKLVKKLGFAIVKKKF